MEPTIIAYYCYWPAGVLALGPGPGLPPGAVPAFALLGGAVGAVLPVVLWREAGRRHALR